MKVMIDGGIGDSRILPVAVLPSGFLGFLEAPPTLTLQRALAHRLGPPTSSVDHGKVLQGIEVFPGLSVPGPERPLKIRTSGPRLPSWLRGKVKQCMVSDCPGFLQAAPALQGPGGGILLCFKMYFPAVWLYGRCMPAVLGRAKHFRSL